MWVLGPEFRGREDYVWCVCCLSSCPGGTPSVTFPPWALEAWKWSRQLLGPAWHGVASSHHTHISVRYSIDCSADVHHQLPAHRLTNEEKWWKILSAVVFIFPVILNKIPQLGGLKWQKCVVSSPWRLGVQDLCTCRAVLFGSVLRSLGLSAHHS